MSEKKKIHQNVPKMGTPAVPVGSPSSEHRSCTGFEPATKPKHTWRAFGCSAFIESINNLASSQLEHCFAIPMNRLFLIVCSDSKIASFLNVLIVSISLLLLLLFDDNDTTDETIP